MAGKRYAKESAKNTNKNTKTKAKKKRTGLKVLLVFLIIIVVLLGVGSGGILWFLNDKFGKMQKVEIDEKDLGISEETEESLSGYRNIALFGVDSRSDNLEAGNRSDCIIIASINNKTKEVRLVSVYRDCYVQIDGHGLDKINHAYSYGSAQLALKTLNKNLDLNISEFVTVNFDSVAEAVDQLGGVTINITSTPLVV